MTLTDTFASNLRALRAQRGLSQSALAALAGCAPAYISMLERGQRAPPLDTVETFARALAVEPLRLLGGGPLLARGGVDATMREVCDVLNAVA